MTLVPGHDVDLVAFDLAGERLRRRRAVDDPPAEGRDHLPGVGLVDAELAGDLQSREVQPHEIQAGDPGPQRLVMAREDGAGEVVEPLAAAAALIAPTLGLGIVETVLDGRGRAARGAGDAIGPPHVADSLEAPGVVEEVPDVHHDGARGTDRDVGQRRPRHSILAEKNDKFLITPESVLSLFRYLPRTYGAPKWGERVSVPAYV